jgi:hypothetical protein
MTAIWLPASSIALRPERPQGGRPQGPGDLFGSRFYKDFAPDALSPPPQQDIPQVMENAKKFGLKIMPLPCA